MDSQSEPFQVALEDQIQLWSMKSQIQKGMFPEKKWIHIHLLGIYCIATLWFSNVVLMIIQMEDKFQTLCNFGPIMGMLLLMHYSFFSKLCTFFGCCLLYFTSSWMWMQFQTFGFSKRANPSRFGRSDPSLVNEIPDPEG